MQEETIQSEEEEEQSDIGSKNVYDVELKASFTMSMKDGQVIKFLPNGDVL